MKPELFAQAIEEFKAIFKEEFGIELTDEEATEKSRGLLSLIDCTTLVKEV